MPHSCCTQFLSVRTTCPNIMIVCFKVSYFTLIFRKRTLGYYLILRGGDFPFKWKREGCYQGIMDSYIQCSKVESPLWSQNQGSQLQQLHKDAVWLHLSARIARSALPLLIQKNFSLTRKRFSGIYDSINLPNRSINRISFNIVKLQKYRHMCMPKRKCTQAKGENIWVPIW